MAYPLLLGGEILLFSTLVVAAPPRPVSSVQDPAPSDAGFNQAQAKFEILLAVGLYIRWPTGALEGPKQDADVFTIGIVGQDPRAEQLQSFVAGRSIAGKRVVLRHYGSASESEPCQILFLAPCLPPDDCLALLKQYKDSPVLLAGETPEFCNAGGGLEFHFKNGNLKFALNLAGLARQRLVVDPRFSRLAVPADPALPPPAGLTAAPGPYKPVAGNGQPGGALRFHSIPRTRRSKQGNSPAGPPLLHSDVQLPGGGNHP